MDVHKNEKGVVENVIQRVKDCGWEKANVWIGNVNKTWRGLPTSQLISLL